MKLKQKLHLLIRRYSRIIVYILAFVIIMFLTVIIARTSLLKPIDLYFYGKVYLNPENVGSPEDYFKFIDLGGINAKGNKFSIKEKRIKVVEFLSSVDLITPDNPLKDPPLVILDVSFSNNPEKLDSIINAIKQLNTKNINVYGVYEMPQGEDMFEDHDPLWAQDLYYDYFEGGRLHTEVHPLEYGVLSYESFIPIRNGIDTVFVPALPIKVINDFTNKQTNDSIKPTYYTLPITKKFLKNVENQTFKVPNESIETAGMKFTELNSSAVSNKILIAGFHDLDNFIIKNDTIPGPYLVGMAMWNEFNSHKLTNKPYDNEVFHLGLEIFCALLVVFIFDLIFKRIKKLQTRTWLIAIFSFLIGLFILYLIGLFLLSSGDVIRPSISIFSMIWASVLAWHFTIKFLVTGIMQGGKVYDVFISYSHGDSIWVKQNLFNPLNEFKKPDGSKLNIFFDEKSIGIGELFTTKYMRGIVDSKLFVPVMSEEYYQKNHCKNEMDLAVKRGVEKLIGLFIIALDYKYVPEEFTNITYVDIKKQTDFMETLQNELVKEEQKHLDEPSTIKQVELEQQDQEEQDKPETIKQAESDHQEPKQSEKKDKKERKKKTKKRSDKKDKKRSPKKDKKQSDKKDKKERKKKKKKQSDKKDRKEQKKKKKKRSEKKANKKRNKKTKKPSNKKNKKQRKKKSKKS